MVKIKINKINLFILIMGITFILLTSLIIAFNSDFRNSQIQPSIHGHSPDELFIKIDNTTKSLKQAIDDGDFTVGSGGIDKIPGSDWQITAGSVGQFLDFEAQCPQDSHPIVEEISYSTTGSAYYYVNYYKGYCVQ